MKMLAIALALLAQVETTPPPPAAPREPHLPKPAEKMLSNGLRVIVVQKPGVPIVATRLLIKTGAEADPANLAGLADMTASLLTKGTKTRSAVQIARGVEALGATLESAGAWDNSFVSLDVMSSNLPKALGYVADIVRNPVFANDEIERLRAQNLDALQVAMHQPRALAGFVATRIARTTGLTTRCSFSAAISRRPKHLLLRSRTLVRGRKELPRLPHRRHRLRRRRTESLSSICRRRGRRRYSLRDRV